MYYVGAKVHSSGHTGINAVNSGAPLHDISNKWFKTVFRGKYSKALANIGIICYNIIDMVCLRADQAKQTIRTNGVMI